MKRALSDEGGHYLGHICRYCECRLRRACRIVAAAITSMTTFMSSRYQMNCLPHRQSSFGQTACGASWFRLMLKQSC